MLDGSICHFGGVWSILSLIFYFNGKILLSNTVGPDQMPHNVASDLGLHFLPMTLLWVSGKSWLRFSWCSLYIFQTIIEVGV